MAAAPCSTVHFHNISEYIFYADFIPLSLTNTSHKIRQTLFWVGFSCLSSIHFNQAHLSRIFSDECQFLHTKKWKTSGYACHSFVARTQNHRQEKAELVTWTNRTVNGSGHCMFTLLTPSLHSAPSAMSNECKSECSTQEVKEAQRKKKQLF